MPITVIVKDSLAQIAPADTAIGRPSVTARRLVDASVSAKYPPRLRRRPRPPRRAARGDDPAGLSR